MTENIKNEITTFVSEDLGEIRTINLNGEPWFVASDVCSILGISNTTMALDRLDEDERSKFNLGRQGEANIVSEPGLYSLIMASRKPNAKSFQRWVTHDIIPSIRKTGGYVVEGYEQNFLSELVKRLDERDKVQHESIIALQKQVLVLQRMLDTKPDMYKINTWKKHTGTPAVERLASVLGMSKVEKSLYGDIYDAMNEYCGFNKVTAVMDYRAKYHLDEDIEVPPINAVADNPVYQRDFVFTVNKMISKHNNAEHSVEQSISVFITPNDRFNAVINPLVELRHDKSAKGAKTLALVYDRMHSKQSWAVMKGKNKCNTNKQLIMKKDSEYDLFFKTVNEMIKEFE